MFSWHPLQDAFGDGTIHNMPVKVSTSWCTCALEGVLTGTRQRLVSPKPLPEVMAASVPGYQPFNATPFSSHLEEWKTEGGTS